MTTRPNLRGSTRREALVRLGTLAIVLSTSRGPLAQIGGPSDPPPCGKPIGSGNYSLDNDCKASTCTTHQDLDCGKQASNGMGFPVYHGDGDCQPGLTGVIEEGRDADCGKHEAWNGGAMNDSDCGQAGLTYLNQDGDCGLAGGLGQDPNSDSDCNNSNAPGSFNSDSECASATSDGDCNSPAGTGMSNNDGDDGVHST